MGGGGDNAARMTAVSSSEDTLAASDFASSDDADGVWEKLPLRSQSVLEVIGTERGKEEDGPGIEVWPTLVVGAV